MIMLTTNRLGWLFGGLIGVVVLAMPPVGFANEDADRLRKEIDAEKVRLQELEERLDHFLVGYDGEGATTASNTIPVGMEREPDASRDPNYELASEELTDEKFPGSWPLFGTKYRMKFGGYFKLDALYDFDGTGDPDQFQIGQIAVEGSPEAADGGYFNMFVRETRFNFDIRNSEKGVPQQQFFLEMDFFDESSDSPRLRHAYVVYGNLLVGQTWTTIAELASIPFTIDFGAGDALFGSRTAQVRWQQDINSEWNWAVALEMLQNAGIYNPLNLGGAPSSKLPVLAGRLTHNTTRGVHSFAALGQQLYWDGEGVGPSASADGWALIYAGRQVFGKAFFTWNMAYGDGTAENIMALTGSDANAILTATGDLITRQGYSVALGGGYSWTKTLSSNLGYAWTDLEDLERASDAIESGGTTHINLIWSPKKHLSTGIEYMWGYRKNADGDSGDAARVQTMVRYSF